MVNGTDYKIIMYLFYVHKSPYCFDYKITETGI